LRGQNLLIGTNDLWIASAALANSLPLVTNNANHFSRVPGLKVLSY
jgi:predicted nucleic acid-binding protein